MAQPTLSTLISIHYRLQYSPQNISEAEKQKEIALMCASDASALGRVLEAVSSRPFDDLPFEIRTTRAEELEHGINTLGRLIAVINDQAVGALAEFFELTDQKEQGGDHDDDA